LKSAGGDERVPGGQEDQSRSCCLLIWERLWEGKDVPGRNYDILGECAMDGLSEEVPVSAHVVGPSPTHGTPAATDIAVDDNPITDLDSFDCLADRRNLAGPICARNVWHLEFQARPSLPNPQIHPIEGGSPQPNLNIVRSGFWRGDFSVFEYL
jgi:hypothetical protein